MPDWLVWLGRFENSKIIALLLFFFAFCGILLYVFTGKKRSRRLESYKYMPLQDDERDLNAGSGEEETNDRNKT